MIPYGQQDITQEDISAVVEVLQSDFLTQGPKVPEFEKRVAEHVGAKYACAVNSATSALHIACMALDLGPEDWLWTSPNTFVASANCGIYCGAKVDFVDIDPATYNLCPDALEQKLITASENGRLPKVVVPVHLCGQPCDMQRINALSQRFGFRIIEDASHAIGGKYHDQFVGSCQFSDITVFSFHPVKIITTAEGGMALTNDAKLAQKLNLHRSHGVTRDPALMTHASDGPWYYQQVALGYNYRMTELQAALGLQQMNRLDDFVSARHRLADRYNAELRDLAVQLPYQLPDTYSGLHLFVIRVDQTIHRQVFEALSENGLGVNLHYIPVHTQPYYQSMGFSFGDFPAAEQYYREAISIPMFHGMTDHQQTQVIDIVKSVLGSFQ